MTVLHTLVANTANTIAKKSTERRDTIRQRIHFPETVAIPTPQVPLTATSWALNRNSKVNIFVTFEDSIINSFNDLGGGRGSLFCMRPGSERHLRTCFHKVTVRWRGVQRKNLEMIWEDPSRTRRGA